MFQRLKEILIVQLRVNPDFITPEATRQDIELDSLAVVELSMLLENEVGIVISDDEIMEAADVGAIARLMEERGASV